MATTADQRAARERKQKIFVVVGGLFLLALLAFQLPKLMGGGSDSAAAETTTATTTADGTPAPPPDTAVPVSVRLVDTDRPLRPGPGQLRTFGMFDRKDPFVQQIATSSRDDGTGAAADDGASAGAGGAGGKAGATPSKGFTVGAGSAASVTVISVNGVRQALAPGTAFPAADPVFVLVAEQPAAKTAVVGVAGGAYANGSRTAKLRVGKPLVLVNTATGARYRIVLVAVGNGAAATTGAEPRGDAPAQP